MDSRGRTLAPKPAEATSSGRHVRLLSRADAPFLARRKPPPMPKAKATGASLLIQPPGRVVLLSSAISCTCYNSNKALSLGASGKERWHS